MIYNYLYSYLFVAIFLLFMGIVGLIYRRTLIGMLISLELIMNGAGLNMVALNRFLLPNDTTGLVFALIVMGMAAAEAALALSMIILIFRRYLHIEGEKLKELKE